MGRGCCAALGNLQLRCAELRDDLFRRMRLRAGRENALLQLRPIDPILAQVVDSFEAGWSWCKRGRAGTGKNAAF